MSELTMRHHRPHPRAGSRCRRYVQTSILSADPRQTTWTWTCQVEVQVEVEVVVELDVQMHAGVGGETVLGFCV